MNKTYRLIVFDWEGTLGDTLGKLLHVLKKEAQSMGLGEINEHEARNYLAFGLVVAIKKLFPDISSRQGEQLLQSIRETLAIRSTDVFLLPGVHDMLEAMYQAGLDLAIASNRSQQSLQRDLQSAALEKYFTVTRTASQASPKPSPEMLEEIMAFCDITAAETLMIGDSISDMEMAAALQVKALGVNFYNQPDQAEALTAAGAEKVFDNYQDLIRYMF